MNFFKEAAKFIAWLSGSVAGIAGIFYACGYLISQAHLRLLGVDGLVDQSNRMYLQYGGDFFFDVLVTILNIVLPLISMVVIGGSSAVLLYLGLKHLPWIGRRITGAVGRLAAFHQRHPRLEPWGWGTYLITLLVFFLMLYESLDLIRGPLDLSGMLYEGVGTVQESCLGEDVPLRDQIRSWMLHEERGKLEVHFLKVVVLVLVAGLLLYLVWSLTANLRGRNFLVTPILVIFIIYASLLPLVYGSLMVKIEFSPVLIELRNGGRKTDTQKDYYLIERTAQEFVLWDAAEMRLVWLPERELKRAEYLKKMSPIRAEAPEC